MSERRQEDEYFARQDAEKLAKLRSAEQAKAHEEALAARKELHWHRCGKCGGSMKTHAFRGVEVEICDDCGATLLDRGELETLAGEDDTGFVKGLLSIFTP